MYSINLVFNFSFLHFKARLVIKDEDLIPSFALHVSLDHIIPTTIGAGVCVTALLDFLVRAHNDFIMECKIKLQEENWYAGYAKHYILHLCTGTSTNPCAIKFLQQCMPAGKLIEIGCATFFQSHNQLF